MILFIVFPFLAMGCVYFLLCAAISPLCAQQFSLVRSLRPCLFTILAAVVLWSLGVDALRRLMKPDFGASLSLHQTSWLGQFVAIITFVITVAGATAITLIHGIIIRRLTLRLFRLYLTVVGFVVGSLTCSFVLFAFAMNDGPY